MKPASSSSLPSFETLYLAFTFEGLYKLKKDVVNPEFDLSKIASECLCLYADAPEKYSMLYPTVEPESVRLFVRDILIEACTKFNYEFPADFFDKLSETDMKRIGRTNDKLIPEMLAELRKLSLNNSEDGKIKRVGRDFLVRNKSVTIHKNIKGQDRIAYHEKFCFIDVNECEPVSFYSPNSVQINISDQNFNDAEPDLNEYKSKTTSGFIMVADEALSTFSSSVDTASYGLVRKCIMDGVIPDNDMVRTEELINYFRYGYPQTDSDEYLSVFTETGDCPWMEQHKVVRIGIKAAKVKQSKIPDSHYVFLIDVSGSMQGSTRLDLVKKLINMLTNQLLENDRISIVVFSNVVKVKLVNVPVTEKQKIVDVVNELFADGGTSGHSALQKAYAVAEKYLIKNGNNRVILCTDGDFNIGLHLESDMEDFITEKAKTDVYLSVFGFGMGNFKDNLVKTLALKGHGNYAYIDTLMEAEQAVVNNFSENMYAMAKDVKIQVEFNPARVCAYRLIGYEVNALNKQDFNNDLVDAGVMGCNQEVTALYELVPADVNLVDPLKYQPKNLSLYADDNQALSNEWLTVKVRYKEPKEQVSRKIEKPVTQTPESDHLPDFNFVLAVALFGQLLSGSKHIGNSNFSHVLKLLQEGFGPDPDGLKHEFLRLVKVAMQNNMI